MSTPLKNLSAGAITAFTNAINTVMTSNQITADWMFQPAGYNVLTVYQSNVSAQPAQQISTQTVYYVSNEGSDTNSGLTPQLPWKTPRAVSNSEVRLADGETFNVPAGTPIAFNGKTNAVITSNPDNPATLMGAAAAATTDLQGPNILTWWTDSVGCILSNVIISSVDGKGFGGNIRGNNIWVKNVLLKNLTEGFDWLAVKFANIVGGGQIGTVQGRCHYLLGCETISWTGDPAHVFGPAVGQSPIRFSTDVGGAFVNNSGGSITGVSVTQVGSPDPIACWAVHNAVGITFTNCVAAGGEFSFDGAGAGTGDTVKGCTIAGLNVSNSKLNLQPIAFNNTFTQLKVTNPTGECVSVQTAAVAGNVINGGLLASPVHAVHFYSANDTIFKDCTYTAPVLMDGLSVAKNDGGGNVKQ